MVRKEGEEVMLHSKVWQCYLFTSFRSTHFKHCDVRGSSLSKLIVSLTYIFMVSLLQKSVLSSMF